MSTLTIGQVHRATPEPTNIDSHNLPSQRAYRAVCVQDDDDTVVECVDQPSYAEAHLCTLEWDSLYDYPRQAYWVERSTDGGATWHVYSASEVIAGRPAWTYDNL